MSNKINDNSLKKGIKTYIDQIEILLPLGIELLDFLKEKQPIQKSNIIIYAFLRKTVRLLKALICLVYEGLEEEAQILVRVLIETKINFDYFLKIASKDFDQTFNRIFDAVMLDKKKALESTGFIINGHKEDSHKWYSIEEEIKNRYTNSEFKKLKNFGFSGLSLESRSIITNNKKLYNLAYRLYSKHIHSTDLNEQLQDILTPNIIPRYSKTRILSLLQAAFNCSVNIINNCNNWMGKPINWPV